MISSTSHLFNQFSSSMNKDIEGVNALIWEKIGSEIEMIPLIVRHIIESGGKRIRPLLTLMTAGHFLSSESDPKIIKLAACIEFMHTATLLHDDVVDNSDLRRGKLAARMHWGNAPCVLVGDFLLGKAFQMMVEVGSLTALQVLSKASAVIAEGEIMQLNATRNIETSESSYLQVIEAKTSELFAVACEVSPILYERSDQERVAFRSYGRAFGIVYQLIDDVLDYSGVEQHLGKTVGDDFREGKITLPILYAFQDGDASEQAFWKRTLEVGEVRNDDFKHAIFLLRKHSALERTVELAKKYEEEALDSLACLSHSSAVDQMKKILSYSLSRVS